jgi:hypothetical protein
MPKKDGFDPRLYVYKIKGDEKLEEYEIDDLAAIIERGELRCQRCQLQPEAGELSSFIETRLCARCDHYVAKDEAEASR